MTIWNLDMGFGTPVPARIPHPPSRIDGWVGAQRGVFDLVAWNATRRIAYYEARVRGAAQPVLFSWDASNR